MELDRDALLIYLNDLRVMETILSESKENIKLLDKHVRSMNVAKYLDKKGLVCPQCPEKSPPPKFSCVYPAKIFFAIVSIIIFVCFMRKFYIFSKFKFYNLDFKHFLNYIFNYPFFIRFPVICLAASVIVFFISLISIISERSRMKKAKGENVYPQNSQKFSPLKFSIAFLIKIFLAIISVIIFIICLNHIKNRYFYYDYKFAFDCRYNEDVMFYTYLTFPVTFSTAAFIGFIISLISIIHENLSVKKAKKISISEYEHKVKIFEAEKNIYDQCVKDVEKYFDKTKYLINELKKEIKKNIRTYDKILKEAYSINIIPMQFRNIEGIYYLYDFLSTSQLTLSDVLMHTEPQTIKDRLGSMIQKQKEAVIQQALTNAKLNEIQYSNQQILNNSRQINANTAAAALYAGISAVNSQVNLQLQSEQLAYQEAELWLKQFLR